MKSKPEELKRAVMLMVAEMLISGDLLEYMGEDFQDTIGDDYDLFVTANKEVAKLLFGLSSAESLIHGKPEMKKYLEAVR